MATWWHKKKRDKTFSDISSCSGPTVEAIFVKVPSHESNYPCKFRRLDSEARKLPCSFIMPVLGYLVVPVCMDVPLVVNLCGRPLLSSNGDFVLDEYIYSAAH